MKQFFHSFAFAAMIIAAGACSKALPESSEYNVPEGMRHVTFTDYAAKTSIGIDGKSIVWEDGDKIAIYDGTQFNSFVYSAETEKFTGDISESATEFYAIYPYEADKSGCALKFTAGETSIIRAYFAGYQVLRKDNLPRYANIAACKPELAGDSNLTGTMLNMAAVLKFTITRNDISKVMFSASKGKMSGAVDIKFADDKISAEGQGERCIVCGSSNGGVIAAGTYYATVCPGVGNYEGMKISLITTSGDIYEYSDSSEEGLDLNRKDIYNFGTIDAKVSTSTPSKWCLPMNFVSNNTDTPTSSSATQTIKVSQDGTDYNLSASGIYQKTGNQYMMWNGNSKVAVWIKSLAVSDKKLSSVVVVFYGNTGNSTTTSYLKTADLSANVDANVFQTPKDIAKLPNPIRVVHVFTPSNPTVNTSYALWNKASASCIEYIGFIYE